MTITKDHRDRRDSRYAVIMAGGSGTRLWPLSRQEKPKQFQLLFHGRSLLQLMYSNLQDFFPPERIYIQAQDRYVHTIKEQLLGIQEKYILREPQPRDTAPAFALAASSLLQLDPDATIGIFYSDNLVQNQSRRQFCESLRTGFQIADCYPEHLVVLGVTPTAPHTGLGYIELGQPVDLVGNTAGAFFASSFVEKPALPEAERLVRSDRFLWNTGYKIARAAHLLRLLRDSSAAYAAGIEGLIQAIKDNDADSASRWFHSLPQQSFEYAVVEKTKQLVVVHAEIEWSDVGDWEVLHRALSNRTDGTTHAEGMVSQIDCQNTLLISRDRPVVALGVRDLVIVETKEVVLVVSKERSQDVKMLLEQILKFDSSLG